MWAWTGSRPTKKMAEVVPIRSIQDPPPLSNMAWFSFRPYISVAQRRQMAAKTAKKMAKQGQHLFPVQPSGRAVAKSFWGLAWCKNLEAYSDYANRLPRGRTYLRNGSVIDLQVGPGLVTALVQGSSLYKIRIQIEPLLAHHWKSFRSECTGQISSLLDLLQGKLSKGVLEAITRPVGGLFPSIKQIKLSCSCPDSASLCKHLAAVIYGIGTRLDEKPELFFTLRAVDMKELVSAAASTATSSASSTAGNTALDGEDLGALFGIELETAAASTSEEKIPSKSPPKGRGKTSVEPRLPAVKRRTASDVSAKKSATAVARKQRKPSISRKKKPTPPRSRD